MPQLGSTALEIVPFNRQKWNKTNIMNARIILTNIKRKEIKYDKQILACQSRLKIQIIQNLDAYIFDQGLIKISKSYVDIAIKSSGHLDVYFLPFIFNKFSFQARLWYAQFDNVQIAHQNYAGIFKQIFNQGKQLKCNDLKPISYENIENNKQSEWYTEQISKVLKGQIILQSLIACLNHTQYNPYIQKLLIGLLGWKPLVDDAVRLLNVYYDNCDWQLTSDFNSTIACAGQPFTINYLIDKPKRNCRTLALCLKALSMDDSVQFEVFSWHIPNLNQYLSDEISYIWIMHQFGEFPRAGFYDWVLFNLDDGGKQSVTKILDIGLSNSKQKQNLNNKKQFLSIRSVKGRFVVHPAEVKALNYHQIQIDCLSSEQSYERYSSFDDAINEIRKCYELGIDCIYMSGIFQRDNQENNGKFLKPHSSPFSFTNRCVPAKMLGGKQGFKKLIQQSHKLGVKIIVDLSCRVSSSRLSKKYEHLRLKAVDQTGKIVYHYGANGKSQKYDDTTVLNYRKKQAWDLTLQQATYLLEEYKVDGFYLDNGFEWPPIYKIDQRQLFRKQQTQSAYTHRQIFQGQIITNTKISGFWSSSLSNSYPNPLLIKLVKTLWKKYPKLIVISQGLQIQNNQNKLISIIRSGTIPRLFKMPKALSQIVGVKLSNTGQISAIQPKNINNLKKWYEQLFKNLPKNSIILHSTTSPVWPYLAKIFKKSAWAVLDLYYFLPSLTMTTGYESIGRAYKQKTINIHYMPVILDRQQPQQYLGISKKSITRTSSSLIMEDASKNKKGSIVQCTLDYREKADRYRIFDLEQAFRKEVGPEFGFDLQKIQGHYKHRRNFRKCQKVLRQGYFLGLVAEHMYGIHNNVLSFCRYNQKQLLLISINFNSNAIDMHYNLTPLKYLFKNYSRSNLVVKLQDVFSPQNFQNQYYLVGQLITSKIEASIKPYQTIVWRLTIQNENKVNLAINCSQGRVKERLSRQPPAWLYSSVFFNELEYLIQTAKTKYGIVGGLNELYDKFITPTQLNFSLVMTKNYQFYFNKAKLQKIFGIFKLISDHPQLGVHLKSQITNLLNSNKLGSIAFVTPQIGGWSSVGGLGVMVDQLSKQLVKLGQQVYIISPYYEKNKKNQTNYLARDGFTYLRNITVKASHFEYDFGIHTGKHSGVNYIWYHNHQLFSKPYDGQGAFYVSKQLVFFALISLQSFCQLKIFPSIIVTNDWMCGFVSAYVKHRKYQVFQGTKFIHICHNLGQLYEGRLYPKHEQGNLNWLIDLPSDWYTDYYAGKTIINPSKCALNTCDNWGTVSNSYKYQLLKQSPLANILWRYPHPFSFPNGIRKAQRLGVLATKTQGHDKSKAIIQKKYFNCDQPKNVPLLAFIGRVTKQKGVHLILDSVQSILFDYNYNVQILVGGSADSKQEYGKHCAQKMRYLTRKYPHCFWSNPDAFFSDGPLVNIGSDFALMPSQFQPGGIVQHQFFCGGTPVVAFCTGGLKDTVFQFDHKTKKGNGFNFMSYQLQDFKRCLKRAINCYYKPQDYKKLRQNAADSVVDVQDVARGWNGQFYRLQNKVYIDWDKVEDAIKKFTNNKQLQEQQKQVIKMFDFQQGQYWKPIQQIKQTYRWVLKKCIKTQSNGSTILF